MNRSQNPSGAPQTATRAFLGTYRLAGELFGVRAYHFGTDKAPREAKLSKSDALTVFYEVAPLPQGAWWLPTSTVEDPHWGGGMPLEAGGDIPTTNVRRPKGFFLWMPCQDVEPVIRPITVVGKVEGEMPAEPPPSENDPC